MKFGRCTRAQFLLVSRLAFLRRAIRFNFGTILNKLLNRYKNMWTGGSKLTIKIAIYICIKYIYAIWKIIFVSIVQEFINKFFYTYSHR